MRVFVDDSCKPIEAITIRLKSANTNFRRINRPIDPYESPNQKNEVMIFLDDSYEIDMLIRMLEEFKKINSSHFGEWRFRP